MLNTVTIDDPDVLDGCPIYDGPAEFVATSLIPGIYEGSYSSDNPHIGDDVRVLVLIGLNGRSTIMADGFVQIGLIYPN